MRIPVMAGLIDRRILANYRVEPTVLSRILPAPFRPQIVNGWGIGGICLIRLKGERPRFFPSAFGFTSENAAHRFAVEWDGGREVKSGVYIPRRDTSSRMNAFLGGRFFPGEHHLAKFKVSESDSHFSVAMRSVDGSASVAVEGDLTQAFPSSSVFSSAKAASAFFECGSLGYSATCQPGVYDGLELKTFQWNVEILETSRCESSYFSNTEMFPAGSVEFDHALLMRKILHEWHGRPTLMAAEPSLAPDTG